MIRPIAFAAALAAAPTALLAQQDGPFTLPDLPYATDALAPAISAETMELHHGKHHQSYVTNLNAAMERGDAPEGTTLEDLVAEAGTYPAAIRNNAGGHWNHSFFWDSMAPQGEGGEMSPELMEAITAVYGSDEAFRDAFEAAGAAQFGSGWVWLIVNEEDELEITSTPNQDNPLMDVAETPGTPLLGNDVWEHAYYLTYENRRPEYLSSWWDVVNWSEVSDRYAAALEE
ncbi:superoxide dismutase [Falsirhodobacter algicola]|uniref:Superoxide dismutase n=1 Tax=Falsirhodobacter algicola TaxID=2692330 RepID=A0A8J8MR09_9RHOB|nr:superoxide dismutase [Falsirhodobacter algicola]QUS35086.1 superoxide dismutase [Falsirhodobacter algicola]